MGLQTLIEKYPEQFARYAEKVLDSYFGNIFVTWRNERILYVNARMAASVRMTKEELTGMTLEQLRDNTEVDMFTTVFIGNSDTALIGGKMVTPRGYLQRGEA